MARSTTKRRAAAPPRRQAASTGAVFDRQPPGGGPGGLTSMSMMRNAVRASPSLRAPQQSKPAAPVKDAAKVVETSKAEAVLRAGANVNAVMEGVAALVPENAAASKATEEKEAPETSGVEAAPQPIDQAVEAGPAPSENDSKKENEKEALPPGETKAEEAPPEPSPEKAVGPATRAVGKRAAKSATHQPAAAATDNAIKASDKPAVTQARMAQDASMKGAEKAKTDKVDATSFKAVLQKAIDESIPEPKSERQAKDVMKNGGKRAAAKVGAGLATQKTQAVGELPAQLDESAVPDASQQKVDPEVPLVAEEVGAPPDPVSAGPVVAPRSTEAAVDVSANREGVDQMQADNKITKDQLEKGNDPQFANTLGARSEAEKNDQQAPKKLREAEAADRANSRARAHGQIDKGLSGFHGERAAQLNNVAGQQADTKGLTETRKQEITDSIKTIADQTRTDVTKILTDMDGKVEEDFAAAIEKAMSDYNKAFSDEKGGVLTAIGDALTGDLFGSDRLKSALKAGREAFDKHITAAINQIAIYVERKLTEARDRVTKGREEVEEYMTTKVSDAEKEFADSAATSITADFDALEGEISAAKDALVSKMVGMYKQGIERRNKREKELREANKSFWQKVWDATVGVVQKVLEFKNMLLGILARAVAVIEAIIQDPIGFLKNLIAGIGAGLQRFVANIGENLKKALMGWLFGALEGAGLKLPDKFDLMGFLDIVLQVLGLTKENVRARAVRILGEETVSAIETAVDFIRVLFTEGPAALWQMLLEKLGDIKEVILAEIRSWVITKVVEAGIKWIIGLLNPAGAFVKACMMIYDIVVFFIERGRQIIEAVNAIINTLGAIVTGNISAMAQAVEGALNRILPVVISFLASLLGLGGISDTIRNFIEAVQKPVNAAIDWIIHQGVAIAKKIGGLFGGKKDKKGQDDDKAANPEVQAKIDIGLVALKQENAKVLDSGALSVEEAEGVAARVRAEHPVFKSIEVVSKDGEIDYAWSANPKGKQDAGNNENVNFTEEEIVSAKSEAVRRVLQDEGLADMIAEDTKAYAEIMEEEDKPLRSKSTMQSVALGMAMSEGIAKKGAAGAPGARRKVSFGASKGDGSVTMTSKRFGPERPNPVIHDKKSKAPSYLAMPTAIVAAAKRLSITRGKMANLLQYWRANYAIPEEYNGPDAEIIKDELEALEAIRMISERQRGPTTLASTALADYEMQRRLRDKRERDNDLSEQDLRPAMSGQPEAAPSGGAKALRMAEDRSLHPDEKPRDKIPKNPTSDRGKENKKKLESAIQHHERESQRQIRFLLDSDRGKDIVTVEDLTKVIVDIIIDFVLDGDYG